MTRSAKLVHGPAPLSLLDPHKLTRIRSTKSEEILL